ncbi:TOMM precursor leader peptide-binding protein [Streptomyces sp. MS06]|uniref:TOMM precursor leader peptide-binding protein n=1 Tax=Streptomyces sp. MS06 TaxID=3385974 RepID=UPI00399FB4C6
MPQAPDSYEEIAQSRPRIRRDVLFTRTPSGVLFHNAHGGFNLVTRSAYRFATLIVPHLDGERRVEELCAGMGDKQRDMVVRLVAALYARGFARDAGPRPPADVLAPQVAERFAHQLDYLDHYADDAPGRFLRYRNTAVAVLGDDALAHWAALGLLRNGCAAVAVTEPDPVHGPLGGPPGPAPGSADLVAEADALAAAGCTTRLTRLPAPAGGTYGWADLDGWDTVLVTGATGRRQIPRLLGETVPAGRRLLPAWTFGGLAVVGPETADGAPSCWCCAALRLGANADAADSADLWASVGPAAPVGAPARTIGGPLAGMLGNLLAFEVFRLVTGALPAETRGQIVIQDLDSLDVLTEPLPAHPRCPFCSDPAARAAAPTAEVLRTPHADDEPVARPADGAADEEAARAALTALEERDVLVHERAGVFTAYADDDWEQTPLKVGTVRLGLGPGRVRRVSAADVHHVAGARLRAVLRAAEVYAEHVVPAPVLHGSPLEAAAGKWTRIDAARLTVSSGLDAPAERLAHWSEAVSLLDGRTVLVPAGAVRTFGGWNGDGLFERTSAGTGAGGSPRAALARALRTALVHDALHGAVRRRAPLQRVDPDTLASDPELLFLLRSADNLGVTPELLDLTAAGGHLLPVVLARLTDPWTGPTRWAAGSGLRHRDAVLEALRDLIGAEQLRRAGEPPDTGDPLWEDLDAASLLADTGPASGTELGPASGTELGSATAADTTWPGVLDGLAAARLDAFTVPVAAPDLAAGGVHAVRVLLTRGERRAD